MFASCTGRTMLIREGHTVMWKLILFAAITGCATPVARQVAINDAEALLAAEYSVYSQLLRGSRDFAVADSTIAMHPAPACSADVRSQCWPERDGVSAEAWNDHSRKNLTRSELQPLFDPDLGIKLERHSGLVAPTCSQPRIVSFTRPGFNKDLTQAVIWVTHQQGAGPFPGCGFVASSLMVLNRVQGGWANPRSLIEGIS